MSAAERRREIAEDRKRRVKHWRGRARTDRRDADDPPDNNFVGYNFWLNKIDQFSVPGENVRDERVALNRVKRAEMVRSFLVSDEYLGRFGL